MPSGDNINWSFNETDCELAGIMARDWLLLAIRAVQILVCTIGILCILPFLYCLSMRTIPLHINIRLTLASVGLAALCSCIAMPTMAIFSLIRLFAAKTDCDLLYQTEACSTMRMPNATFVYAVLSGMLVVAIERMVATAQFRTYEKQASVVVAIVLVCFQWTISLAVGLLGRCFSECHGIVHYCTIFVTDSSSAPVKISIMLALELLALILYIYLLYINKRKKLNEFINCSMHSLTERYQLQENIRLMQSLIPIILVHAGLSLTGLAALFGYMFLYPDLDGTIRNFAPLAEILLVGISLFGIAFPCLIIRRNPSLRIFAARSFPCICGSSEEVSREIDSAELRQQNLMARASENSEQYFIMLNDMWQRKSSKMSTK